MMLILNVSNAVVEDIDISDARNHFGVNYKSVELTGVSMHSVIEQATALFGDDFFLDNIPSDRLRKYLENYDRVEATNEERKSV